MDVIEYREGIEVIIGWLRGTKVIEGIEDIEMTIVFEWTEGDLSDWGDLMIDEIEWTDGIEVIDGSRMTNSEGRG